MAANNILCIMQQMQYHKSYILCVEKVRLIMLINILKHMYVYTKRLGKATERKPSSAIPMMMERTTHVQ